MSPSPYRLAADRPVDPPSRATCSSDVELGPVFLVVWLASLVRVGCGLSHGEIFGSELTLAALALVALPLLMKDALCAILRTRGEPESP